MGATRHRRLTAGALLTLALIFGTAAAAAPNDERDCALFRAAVDLLGSEGRLPSDLGAPSVMAAWHFALSQPYPDRPLAETIALAFPGLAAARYPETTLPPGVAYKDFDRTDDSDGYRPVCGWYGTEGRNWTQSSITTGYRIVFFRPAVATDGRSAIMNVIVMQRVDYGHSVHNRRTLRVLCQAERRGRTWRVSACRDVR